MDFELLPELVVERIYQNLDPISALALGSCSRKLGQILLDYPSFEKIVDQVEFKTKTWNWNEDAEDEDNKMSTNTEMVKKIVNFIDIVLDRDETHATHESDFLTMYLVKTIARKFQCKFTPFREEITVSVEDYDLCVSVDSWGLLLLAHTKARLSLVSCVFDYHLDASRKVSGSLLMTLGSLVKQDNAQVNEVQNFEKTSESQNGKETRKVKLGVIWFDSCLISTQEEESALTSLLSSCKSWTIFQLTLCKDVGGSIWSVIGKAAERGGLYIVKAETEVVKRGRLEDLRRVWEITDMFWSVGTENGWKKIKGIFESEGTENGWKKIKGIFESE